MDTLILLSLQGQATPAQERELLAWRRADPANEAHYRSMVALWELAGVGTEPVLAAPRPSAAEVIERAAVDEAGAESRPAAHRHGWRTWGLAAAAVAGLLLLGGEVIERLTPTPSQRLAFGVEEFVTGEGETATVSLRDGSVIRLAPESRLRLVGTLHEREVTLDGRAFFAVARQPGRPFRIHTAAGDVTVLGTRFDLTAEREDLRVAVVEGRVAVAARGQEVEAVGGQLARVLEGTLLPLARIPDADSLTSWKGSFLAFQRTPLREAVREIGRQYGVRIVVEDPELADRTITTWFTDRSLEDVLRIVCAVAAAECRRDGEVYRIEPAGAAGIGDFRPQVRRETP